MCPNTRVASLETSNVEQCLLDDTNEISSHHSVILDATIGQCFPSWRCSSSTVSTACCECYTYSLGQYFFLMGSLLATIASSKDFYDACKDEFWDDGEGEADDDGVDDDEYTNKSVFAYWDYFKILMVASTLLYLASSLVHIFSGADPTTFAQHLPPEPPPQTPQTPSQPHTQQRQQPQPSANAGSNNNADDSEQQQQQHQYPQPLPLHPPAHQQLHDAYFYYADYYMDESFVNQLSSSLNRYPPLNGSDLQFQLAMIFGLAALFDFASCLAEDEVFPWPSYLLETIAVDLFLLCAILMMCTKQKSENYTSFPSVLSSFLASYDCGVYCGCGRYCYNRKDDLSLDRSNHSGSHSSHNRNSNNNNRAIEVLPVITAINLASSSSDDSSHITMEGNGLNAIYPPLQPTQPQPLPPRDIHFEDEDYDEADDVVIGERNGEHILQLQDEEEEDEELERLRRLQCLVSLGDLLFLIACIVDVAGSFFDGPWHRPVSWMVSASMDLLSSTFWLLDAIICVVADADFINGTPTTAATVASVTATSATRIRLQEPTPVSSSLSLGTF